MKEEELIKTALALAMNYAQIDGSHHKMWVIDQIVRILADNTYDKFVKNACAGKDGPNTYEWDTGISP